MDRPSPRYRYLLAAVALVITVLPAYGCVGFLTTILYLVKGTDIPAEYDGLKEKRVAVVCRPMVSLKYRNSTAAKDLSREVSKLLKQKVKKIKLVDPRQVDEWVDEHSWNEYADVGKALKADVVVGIDLEDFSVFLDPTLYQGKANVTLTVIDCENGDEAVFERHLPQVVYPPNCGVPASDRPENQFRRQYLAILADRVARYFYPHDPYQDQALDATSL